jgi:hypothetical protein
MITYFIYFFQLSIVKNILKFQRFNLLNMTKQITILSFLKPFPAFSMVICRILCINMSNKSIKSKNGSMNIYKLTNGSMFDKIIKIK